MKLNRKAVISLPIRLMVVFLILAISTPALINVLEENERTSSISVLDHEFSRFTDSVAKAHYSGTYSMKTITLNIPENCEVFIGGDGSDAYSIRGTYNGEEVLTRYMEQPAVMFINSLKLEPGSHELTIRSVTHSGKGAAEVMIL